MVHSYGNNYFDNDNFIEYKMSQEPEKVDQILEQLKEELGDAVDELSDRDFYKLYKNYALRS